MKKINAIVAMLIGLGLVFGGAEPVEAQKKGQSAKVSYGVVVKSERVDLSDNKTTKGALVGGSMMYTVETAGGAIKVVTDQTEIHMGDCVMVEETSQGANIRRADPAVCMPAAADVDAELQQEFQEEAAECAAAKAELSAAKTDAELDRALMKVDILCNG